MIEKAKAFATKAHDGQVRKYSGEPYITHPLAVADIVASVRSDESMIVAAILHDTVEDTEVTIDDILLEFGFRVADLVDDLTDISKPEDGNRRIRKGIDCSHTYNSSPDAKTIKLADLIHNTESIVKCDPDFSKVYMKEKAALLRVLRSGDYDLYQQAMAQVDEYYANQ